MQVIYSCITCYLNNITVEERYEEHSYMWTSNVLYSDNILFWCRYRSGLFLTQTSQYVEGNLVCKTKVSFNSTIFSLLAAWHRQIVPWFDQNTHKLHTHKTCALAHLMQQSETCKMAANSVKKQTHEPHLPNYICSLSDRLGSWN